MRWFKYTVCYSLYFIFDVLRIFEALQIFFYKFLLKWGKLKKILSPAYSLKLKNVILLLNWGLIFFWNGHIRNVVLTLPNIVKVDIENDNVVSTLSNVVQFNVEIYNVVSTLLNVVNFNVDLTLCDVATSYQPKTNVEPTFKCLLGSPS